MTVPPRLRCCGGPLTDTGHCQHRPNHLVAPEAADLSILRACLADIDHNQGEVSLLTWVTIIGAAQRLARHLPPDLVWNLKLRQHQGWNGQHSWHQADEGPDNCPFCPPPDDHQHLWQALRSVPPSWRCHYCGERTEKRPS